MGGGPFRSTPPPMPPPIAPAGKAHVEITVRTAGGVRAHFVGVIDAAYAAKAFGSIVLQSTEPQKGNHE